MAELNMAISIRTLKQHFYNTFSRPDRMYHLQNHPCRSDNASNYYQYGKQINRKQPMCKNIPHIRLNRPVIFVFFRYFSSKSPSCPCINFITYNRNCSASAFFNMIFTSVLSDVDILFVSSFTLHVPRSISNKFCSVFTFEIFLRPIVFFLFIPCITLNHDTVVTDRNVSLRPDDPLI